MVKDVLIAGMQVPAFGEFSYDHLGGTAESNLSMATSEEDLQVLLAIPIANEIAVASEPD